MPATAEHKAEVAQRHRDRMAKRSREQSEAVAEVGEIPPVKNPERRAACRLNLELALQTYFPNSTGLSPFSPDHKVVIGNIQRSVLEGGGRSLNVVYRGFGKTSLTEGSVIWATAYGHRRCVPIYGADEEAATENITSIRLEFETNELLMEDFPEICVPVRALEGKPQRCHSQTYLGELTHMRWMAGRLVLPTIPGSAASGAVIFAKGLGGGSRGSKKKTADGENLRPDFVIIDDPQTDASARSKPEIRKRMRVLKNNILKQGSHRGSLSVVVNATAIAPGDIVGQLSDKKLNPSWKVNRFPFVRAWSKAHKTLWVQYAEIRHSADPKNDDDIKRARDEATAFYLANREAMDEECVVGWDSCFNPEVEVSAIQHAYNMLFDDGEESFASEMQQEPEEEQTDALPEQSAEAIRKRTNGIARSVVPVELPTLVAYSDVQGEALYWVVSAWGGPFSGAVVDYGTWPEQQERYFRIRDIRLKLSDLYPGRSEEGRLHAGIMELAARLINRDWQRFGMGTVRLRRLLMDARYKTDTVFGACRASPYAGQILPSFGHGVPAKKRSMLQWEVKPGEVKGRHYIIRSGATRGIPHATIDTNFWKTFIHTRLAIPLGEPGALTLFGDDPKRHEMFVDHLLGEYRTRVTGPERTADEWEPKVGEENHWLDCLAGCAAAAAIEGVTLPEWGPDRRERRVGVVPEHLRPGGRR